MLNNFASTQGGGTDTVTTTMILDGTIANADVASDAAIDLDKLSQASEQKLGIGTEQLKHYMLEMGVQLVVVLGY